MRDNSEHVTVEVLSTLRRGTIVRLPDGTVGEVAWSCYAEVHVIHADAILGAGPWYFARFQVTEATPAEAAAYTARRDRLTRLRGHVSVAQPAVSL